MALSYPLPKSRIMRINDRLRRLPAATRMALAEALARIERGENLAQTIASGALGEMADRLDRALAALGLDEEEPRQRVVITGIGAITPVGLSAPESWDAFVHGHSGVDTVTRVDPDKYPSKIAAEVKDFEPTKHIPRKEARRMARCSQFAVSAAYEALEDAGLSELPEGGVRTGVVIGTGLGGFELYEDVILKAARTGTMRVSPMVATGGLPNMPAFHISQTFGAKGPNSTVVTACAAGTQALGEAAELIRRGVADVVIAGGVEALISDLFFAGFSSMHAISTRNDKPQKASRPFDAKRDGFVIGEGAAILILESLDHALARGARIYAELLGEATSADAYHIAAPEPQGQGAVNAMRWALLDAGIAPEEVDYINAHGTSTPLNDKTETLAIKRVFGKHAYELAVSSTKSMIGHAFGGAGAIEAMACVYTVHEDVIHPTINYENPDPE
ncbi:MAG TPA: beta-ketoacyl-[acyl-carrier-protein] synthase II, partial [Anaerolineae bacterium]|nr:beta-ketoacyl-[acyl-carrier-protein] synthase II [Anaerolineae bacterium]